MNDAALTTNGRATLPGNLPAAVVRRGYHHVVLPDGTRKDTPYVVVTNAQGAFLSCHALQGEEASVEWVGGTCDLRLGIGTSAPSHEHTTI